MSQLAACFSRTNGNSTTSSAAAATAVAAVCLGAYLCIRPALTELRPLPIDRHIIRARTRAAAEAGQPAPLTSDAQAPPPYRLDEFPGGRQVTSSYGTIQVFEWGPEEGEKVLLLHGIGTPCIALGDMAREFVERGCRVMLFGKFEIYELYTEASISLCAEYPATHRLIW